VIFEFTEIGSDMGTLLVPWISGASDSWVEVGEEIPLEGVFVVLNLEGVSDARVFLAAVLCGILLLGLDEGLVVDSGIVLGAAASAFPLFCCWSALFFSCSSASSTLTFLDLMYRRDRS